MRILIITASCKNSSCPAYLIENIFEVEESDRHVVGCGPCGTLITDYTSVVKPEAE